MTTRIRKHGFYSTVLRRTERNQLVAVGNGLEDEITLLRVVMRRVAECAMGENHLDVLTSLLDTLGEAGVRLSSMLRVQKKYFESASSDNPYEKAYFQALHEVLAEQRAGAVEPPMPSLAQPPVSSLQLPPPKEGE